MNATCSAGILQPQRVSDLGRLLNSEITAPLDSTARGVCNTSMAPAHLQGALFNICMAPAHLQGALTSPCARQFFIPTRGSVCPPTSKVAISSSSGVSKETWLSLISPLEMPDDARRASRSAQRRRSFPSSSTCKFSFLLYFQSTGLRPGLLSSKSRPRANQTTAHDETSRARRHEGRTAPYQGTARRLHRLARTADMRPCSLLLRVFSTLVIESLESHEFRIGNLSVTPKVTSYYSHTKTSARYVS